MRVSPSTVFAASVFTLTGLVFTTPVHAARPCPSDLNCDGAINVDDLLQLIGEWGQFATPGDVDGSGIVNIDDLLVLLSAWGPCQFDFGTSFKYWEALQIGLEQLGPDGPLLLDQATYDRIDRDLGLIRAEFPELEFEYHSAKWPPNTLIVAVFQGLPTDDFVCTNAYNQSNDPWLLFSAGGRDYFVVTVGGNVNVEALALIYEELTEVDFAEPDSYIGGSNYWIPTPMEKGIWQWNIDDGFHDCFDGCDCHRDHTIITDESGTVVRILYTETGQLYCEF